MTLLELFRSSLRLIQEMAPGQTPHVDDTTDGLFVLNSMLDAWKTERLLVYGILRSTYAIGGADHYTIGPSGQLDGDRPLKLEKAALIESGGTQEWELPVINSQEWQEQRGRYGVHCDDAFPDATLYFSVGKSGTLVLYTWIPITQFEAITDEVLFPPGYADAIRYNLAVRLAPEWGRVLRADVAAMARETKATVKRLNSTVLYLAVDDALLTNRVFNIFRGRY